MPMLHRFKFKRVFRTRMGLAREQVRVARALRHRAQEQLDAGMVLLQTASGRGMGMLEAWSRQRHALGLAMAAGQVVDQELAALELLVQDSDKFVVDTRALALTTIGQLDQQRQVAATAPAQYELAADELEFRAELLNAENAAQRLIHSFLALEALDVQPARRDLLLRSEPIVGV